MTARSRPNSVFVEFAALLMSEISFCRASRRFRSSPICSSISAFLRAYASLSGFGTTGSGLVRSGSSSASASASASVFFAVSGAATGVSSAVSSAGFAAESDTSAIFSRDPSSPPVIAAADAHEVGRRGPTISVHLEKVL